MLFYKKKEVGSLKKTEREAKKVRLAAQKLKSLVKKNPPGGVQYISDF